MKSLKIYYIDEEYIEYLRKFDKNINSKAIDIFKIRDGELGVVNINNMIPTPIDKLTEVLPIIKDSKYKRMLEEQSFDDGLEGNISMDDVRSTEQALLYLLLDKSGYKLEGENKVKGVMLIITDGGENGSQNYTEKDVSKALEELEKRDIPVLLGCFKKADLTAFANKFSYMKKVTFEDAHELRGMMRFVSLRAM